MEAKEKLRDLNHNVQRQGAHWAGVAPDRELAQAILRDDAVRAAAREVLGWVVELRRELSGKGGGLRKLARDAGVQDEIAALVRSAAKTLDAGTAVGKRKARRRIVRIAVSGVAVAGALVWLQRAVTSRPGPAQVAPATMPTADIG